MANNNWWWSDLARRFLWVKLFPPQIIWSSPRDKVWPQSQLWLESISVIGHAFLWHMQRSLAETTAHPTLLPPLSYSTFSCPKFMSQAMESEQVCIGWVAVSAAMRTSSPAVPIFPIHHCIVPSLLSIPHCLIAQQSQVLEAKTGESPGIYSLMYTAIQRYIHFPAHIMLNSRSNFYLHWGRAWE
jgi:hypothetical protein